MWFKYLLGLVFVLLSAAPGLAAVFGTVRGIVHDQQHRPIQGATVTLNARASEWTQRTQTDRSGEFEISAVPAGRYEVTVSHTGFRPVEQQISVQSGGAPVLHFPLALAEVQQTVEVSAAPELVNPESSTTESLVDRNQIERLPGADRTNSLAMITDLVPGTNVVHDQLHIRGGHQVSWLIDGIPLPNTNIADNVGPQLDPKDIDYVEVQRGGYSAEFGDRTYGVFNVVPRTGFERNNEAELVVNYGSYNQTNSQFSVGGHTTRFAYYTSATGSRSDLGLQPPALEVLHDRSAGTGGFTSLIYNPDPADQLRLVASLRGDHYQVPNTSEGQDLGLRDTQDERDEFVTFSWVRTLGPGKLLTVSPLFHRNRANFQGGPGDTPVIARDDRTSDYAGGQVNLSVTGRKHNLRLGLSGMAQHDDRVFSLLASDASGPGLEQNIGVPGSLETAFVEDQYRLAPWLTLNGGVRLTYFSGLLTEKLATPRLGAAIRLPRLNWVLRGFYGRYYQPPPLSTVSGPLLDLALSQGFGFLPLHGERDEQKEIGVSIPFRGWAFDISHYHTNARNFFDHEVLGNSDIFFPLTIAGARLRGWEVAAQSPQLYGRAHVHLSLARQFAQGQGAVTGGLTDFEPPEPGMFFLDHDQRYTVAAGFEAELPGKCWLSGNFSYGSGFLDGDGPTHLSGHATADLSVGKSIGESLSLRLSALNVTDSRYLLDNSNTFGGTHYNYPREITVTLRYRFHY